jgi:hypothetical protein
MTAQPNVTNPVPLVDTRINDRLLLVPQGVRTTFGGIGWAYLSSDVTPLDQVQALIAVASGVTSVTDDNK